MATLIELEVWALETFKPKPPSNNTLYKMCKDGTIPAKKLGGTWYVLLDRIQEFFAPAPKVAAPVAAAYPRKIAENLLQLAPLEKPAQHELALPPLSGPMSSPLNRIIASREASDETKE